MTSFKTFLLLFFVLPLSLMANFCFNDCCCNASYCYAVQARASAYFPFENRLRKIYSNTWGFYELEVDVPVWCNVGGYLSAGYLENSGRSLCFRNRTQLQMVPLALGLKYFVDISSNLQGYIGAGALYSFLNIRDHSEYVHQHISKNCFGGTAKVGFVWYMCDNWFIDASVDYVYQYFKFKTHYEDEPFVVRHNLNMSGMKVGAGIGYAF